MAVIAFTDWLAVSRRPPVSPSLAQTPNMVTTASGLKYWEWLSVPRLPRIGDLVSLCYTATLKNGMKIDPSYHHGANNGSCNFLPSAA